MKSAFMALLAILILGAGGAGAYFYFQQPAQASIGDTAKHKETKADAHGGGHGKSAFVELDPLILPIIDNNGVSQVVSLVVVIEVENEKKAEEVRKYEPRLKDAYLQALYGVLNKHVALQGGVIKVDMIKKHLQDISHKVMGDDVINGVLLQVVQQRPV